jgi:hypothetical protein
MTRATKAQLPKQAIRTMSFEEMNSMPPLEVGRTTCQRTKMASSTLMNLDLKVYQKFSSKSNNYK